MVVDKLQIINRVNEFPVGNLAKTKEESLAKISVVADWSTYAEQFASVPLEQRSAMVGDFLKKVYAFTPDTKLPNLQQCAKTLGLAFDYVDNVDKILYNIEKIPKVGETYNLLADKMGLNEVKRQGR